MKLKMGIVIGVAGLALQTFAWADAPESCYSCHDQSITGEHKTIPNIKAEFDLAYSAHKGLACSDCHLSHEAANAGSMLNGNYPTQKHAAYVANENANTYGLCFSCHDTSMLNKQIGETETQFFNVDTYWGKTRKVNLHWSHVVRAHVDGNPASAYSCSVCHNVHGAAQAHNLRPDALPEHTKLHYQSATNGGTCAGSCHSDASYSRK